MQGSRWQNHCKGNSKSSLATSWWHLSSPQMRPKSRKPLWSDMEPNDIIHCWRPDCSTTSVVNHDLANDATVRVPGFSLPRAQWCTLNRFRTGQSRCASCLKKWGLSSLELCACGDTETTSRQQTGRWHSPSSLCCWKCCSVTECTSRVAHTTTTTTTEASGAHHSAGDYCKIQPV